MGFAKQLIRQSLNRALNPWQLFVLDQIKRKAPYAGFVADGVASAVRNRLAEDEKAWIDRIEELRSLLNSSNEEIAVIDYGAGSISNHINTPVRAENSTVGYLCRMGSKPYFWAVLLFHLVRNHKPAVCLELGTSLGISGSYQAAALNLNGNGKLITIEGSPEIASRAAKHFNALGLKNVIGVQGLFDEKLPGVLSAYQPIDYVFIDGHHDEQATIRYFEQIYPFLSPRALLVFDDINWSAGMKKAWEKIIRDPRIGFSLDLHYPGICLLRQEKQAASSWHIPFI